MVEDETQNRGMGEAGVSREGVKGVVREVAHHFVHLAILLFSAGTAVWLNAWLCFGMGLAYLAINTALLIKLNPLLINKRARLIQGDTKRFDKTFIAIYLPLGAATSAIAGFDAGRPGWSDMAPAVIITGVVVYVLACAFGSWTMAVNGHFETTVIIKDGQRVCDSGPYKIVRHPGYAAAILGGVGYTLILGSWLALLPLAAMAALFVTRTALEDKALQKELPGYSEFAQKTRYRLAPFVW